jgi:hypothetical protein
MHPLPYAGLPTAALVARAITFLQGGLGWFGLALFVPALLSPQRSFGWGLVLGLLGSLAQAVLALTSGLAMGGRRPCAWWGALATNLTAIAVWIAVIVWIAIDTSQYTPPPEDVDSGMVLVAFVVVGLPAMAVSLAAIVVLLLSEVRSSYLARRSAPTYAATRSR